MGRMKIITEPTVLAEGGQCDELLAMSNNLPESKQLLQSLLEQAFEAGNTHGSKKKPAPQSTPVAKNTSGKVPAYRTWADIDETGPENPIERFIFNDFPNDDAEGINSEGWIARFHAALEYVVK